MVTNKSPWLQGAVLDEVYAIPASHGEGRFVASEEWAEKLFANGQVATQYVNLQGKPTMDYITIQMVPIMQSKESPARMDVCLVKWLTPERIGENVAKNIYAKKDQKIFESGVALL